MKLGTLSPRLAALLERLARGEGPTRAPRDEVARDAGTRALPGLPASTTTPDELIELFRRAASLCPTCSLEVAGYPVEVRISIAELWQVYLPLCRALRESCTRDGGARALVGVAGPPGSGKSVFAELLRELLDAGGHTPGGDAVVVPQDGFHFPNAYLDTHTTTGPDGKRQALRMRKGGPDTFDVAAFVRALDRLHSEATLALPRYDRRAHDPVPGAIRVEPHHRIALVEGNYLLLGQDGWESVAERMDLRLFLRLPLEAIRPHMIARHVRGGRSPEDAAAHFERVDVPNYELCMRSATRADLVIERGPDQRITAVSEPGRRARR